MNDPNGSFGCAAMILALGISWALLVFVYAYAEKM
jgi:hypothetical protein